MFLHAVPASHLRPSDVFPHRGLSRRWVDVDTPSRQHGEGRRLGATGAPKMGSKRAGDWTCPSCKSNVFASKRECFLCQTPKPTDGEVVLVGGEAAPPLSKPVEQMKMAELRRALEARGLKPAGLRPALVARLQGAVLASGEGAPQSEASVTPPPAALPAGALPWVCQHCGVEHPSRNALFRHLTSSCDPTAAAGPPTERVGEPAPEPEPESEPEPEHGPGPSLCLSLSLSPTPSTTRARA